MSAWPYAVSVGAGVLTTLSPCVLPVLPLVVGGALQAHRLGPVALAAGMVASFTALTLALAAAGHVLGLEQGHIRAVAGAALALFGAALLSARLSERVAAAGSPLSDAASRLLARIETPGLRGQFLIGALLGAVWTPCSGPTLGAALGLASESGGLAPAALTMALFGLGASLPMLAAGYGARRLLLERREALAAGARKARAVFGAAALLLGLAILTGADKALDARLVAAMPSWLIDLTTRY